MRRIVLPRPPTPPWPRVPDDPVFSAAGGVWALLLGVGLLMLGNGLQGTLLGVRAEAEGFGATVTGLVMSGFFVGFLVGSQLAPHTIRRVGHLRVFAAIASIASMAILVAGVWVTPLAWAMMRLVIGYCFATALIVAESWLNDRVTNEHRGGLLSIYMIVTYLGMGGGQLLLTVADPGGLLLFVLVSLLISGAAVPILLSITPQPATAAPERLSVATLYRVSPLGLVGAFSAGILQGTVFGMGAVFARSSGLSVADTATFMFVLVAGAAVLQWPLGKLSDRMDRRRVIAVLALGAAMVSLLAVVVTRASTAWLLPLAALIGAGPMLLYSLFIAYTNDHLRPEQMVAASSALILVFGSGAILGPSLAGALMDTVGPGGFLWLLAAAQAGIGAFALYRMRRTPAAPVAAQTAYAASTGRTPALAPAVTAWARRHEPGDGPESGRRPGGE